MTILQEAYSDCVSDLQESLYLLGDANKRLSRFLRDIEKIKQHIRASTFTETIEVTQHHRKTLRYKIDSIKNFLKIFIHSSPSVTLITEATTIKNITHEYLRTHQAIFGALITTSDWQSPSFSHSLHSQAGRQTGMIYETINDYKRDQHWDAHRWERTFLQQYIDTVNKFPVQVFATSSGMAAFTTILNYLLLEKHTTGTVLMGQSTYFENKELIKAAFKDRVMEVDETDTESVCATIIKHKPCIIFFDTVTNAPRIPVPDNTSIFRCIEKNITREHYVVIDNTCMPIFFQPLKGRIRPPKHMRLIVFESLNKYHQFGMDRVTGGIIWGLGKVVEKIFDYRVHLGTNIPDIIVASLPTPNRKYLSIRLRRHERNTRLIAGHIETWIENHSKSPFERIWYPGLPSHPSNAWSSTQFSGSYFTIEFKKKYQTVSCYKRFVAAIISQAKRKKIDITAGTSFGFNITRIYLTAIRSHPTTPFVRISVGTEHIITVETIKNIFTSVCSQFR